MLTEWMKRDVQNASEIVKDVSPNTPERWLEVIEESSDPVNAAYTFALLAEAFSICTAGRGYDVRRKTACYRVLCFSLVDGDTDCGRDVLTKNEVRRIIATGQTVRDEAFEAFRQAQREYKRANLPKCAVYSKSKLCFETREEAEEEIVRCGHVNKRAFPCVHCGCWHVGGIFRKRRPRVTA